ncbi:tetraspanin 36 [Dunckerocampus dactyliophorus]|uniref:tetraspanin 36 n=1 Tax=Dunckerocampus dactyliophorus TaxID=161453 RepID=UPI00240642DF|nr:tetraspanin 36 [Dunckerocampus dactyliophorus]
MDCSIVTSKTVLVFVSLVFWVAGAGLAYVGAQVLSSYDTFDRFVQDRYTVIPAVVIICISVVMFFFGLLGCYATMKESKVGLSCFFMIIMVLFIAEVAALVLSFIYQGKLNGDLENSMNIVFGKFGSGDPETKAVDYLQTELQCCGVSNYSDWSNTTWYRNHNRTVPLSCCKNVTAQCTGKMDELDLLNLEGCEAKLELLLQDILGYAMLVILAFAIVKVFGMLSVCVISCQTGSRRSGYQPLYA